MVITEFNPNSVWVFKQLILKILTICSFHAKAACQFLSSPMHSGTAIPASLPRHVGPASRSWIPKPTGEAAGISPWQTHKQGHVSSAKLAVK